MGRATANLYGPAPWGPGEGSKGQKKLFFNYKVNFKDFVIPNFVCVLTNEIYKTDQTGFSFYRLGHALGVGLGGCLGVKNTIPSVRPLCYLLINHWTKSNQIWCVSYSHELGVQQQKMAPPPPPLGPLGEVKRSNIIKLHFQWFLYQTFCVLTNKR